jgi:hypothetical protein
MAIQERPYRCERCKAVLGIVFRGNDHRLKVNVFRVSIVPGELPHTEKYAPQKIYLVKDLEQGKVVCGMCGAVQPWNMSETALKKLNLRRRRKTPEPGNEMPVKRGNRERCRTCEFWTQLDFNGSCKKVNMEVPALFGCVYWSLPLLKDKPMNSA